MILYEIRKNIHFSSILLFGLVLLLEFVGIRMGIVSIDLDRQDEIYYIEYTQRWNGVLTETTEAEIIQEKEFIESTLSQTEEKKVAYMMGEITKEEYESYLGDLSYCRRRADAFPRLYMDYVYVKGETEGTESSAKPEIFYKEYWKRFMSPDGFDYFAVILMVIFSINVGFIEKDSLMTLILHSSEKGRYDILKNKIQAGAIVTGIMALIINLLKCFMYYRLGYLPNGTSPASSLEFFSGTAFPLPLYAMAIIGTVGNVLASMVMSQILILISYLLSRKMSEIVIAAVCLFGIEIIKGILPVFYAYMPGSLLNVFNVFRYAARGTGLFLQIVLILSVLLFYAGVKEGLRYLCRRKLKF